MKKAFVALLVLLLCAGTALPVFARGAKKEKPQASQKVYVQNPSHRQDLGGESGTRSQKGLQNAAEHSNRLDMGKPEGGGGPEVQDDDIGGSDSKG